MSELVFMRKLEIFKFGSGEVHNLKFMSQTVNEWAAANNATLVNVSVSVDNAGYLFVAVIYEDAPDES
jgi:hypothetical protein